MSKPLALKNKIINQIIITEGGYVDDSDDSGGKTKYGITEAVARANGYPGEMKYLPKLKAFEIYKEKYWDAVSADKLALLSIGIAEEVVDTAVNIGPKKASKFLQRALNILNKKQSLYWDLKIDGKIGPVTLRSLKTYLTHRDAHTLTKLLNIYQGAFYIKLTERHEKDETHIYGWLRNRVNV